jgi:FrsA-like alpha/beta hydrolase family protein
MTEIPLLDPEFREQLMVLLGQAHHGGCEIDEVLATARRIRDGDADSWVLEWVWSAGSTWAAANAALSSGRRRVAAVLYLQAAGYYAAALSQIAGSSERERTPAVWRRQRACWEQAVSCGPVTGRRIEIPYEGTSLPGYFFAAPGAAGRRRPLVIMHNGAYLATSSMWGLGGAAAGPRGYHWLTFDGPGQQAALFHRGLLFRPDWEVVLEAVLDAVTQWPEVDRGRIATVGFGQAGFWLPRALAYEHRLAAAAVLPGIVDLSPAWTSALPPSLAQMLADGDLGAFDRQMRAALLFDRRAAGRLYWHALPYGLAAAPPRRLFAEVARYRLTDEPARITTPLLIADGGGGHWPRQSCLLHAQTASDTTLVVAKEDGRDRDRQLFDWLERLLSG